MSRKSVRFQDLSFIQESEEDQPEDADAEVLELNVPSPAQTGGAPGSSTTGASEGQAKRRPLSATVRPPACPFGERIAQERAEREQLEQTQQNNHLGGKENCGDQDELPFPSNIIYIQQEERKKLTKKKKSAGINPSAGKEKGSSFIITRNYLHKVTDNSTVLQPRSTYIQNIQETNNEVIDQVPQASSISATPSCFNDPYFTNVDNEPHCDINSVSIGLPLSQTVPPHSNIATNDCVSLYKPDSSLAQFVNPYTAPSVQLYGSAAYALKQTPIDTLSKPDVLTSSSVNQYLHHPKDYRKDCLGNYYTNIKTPQPLVANPINLSDTSHIQNQQFDAVSFELTSPNTQREISEERTINTTTTRHQSQESIHNLKPTPSLQFLRDNLTSPEVTLHKATYSSTARSDQIAQLPSTSRGPAIGPIVVSPRKQVLPQRSSPGLIIDSQQAPPTQTATATTPTPTANMNYIGGTTDIYNHPAPLSRFQEKEELQRLNERFTSYITRVRQLGQHANNVDTSAFLRSTKILEDEIVSLKRMYENELASLRQEIEVGCHERNSLHVQCNKNQKYAGEVQDRLAIESEKNVKLLDEINVLQRKISNLEAEIQDSRIASQRPKEEMDQLHRTVENLTRESDQWKHRYDHEQVARQESEDRVQQLVKKIEFADQVHLQEVNDYQSRLDTASATILSLEGKVRELSTADVTMAEMLKQVRETAETELKKFQIESEEQYGRNLSALKAQIDNDADTLSRFQAEKSQMIGNVGELQARIRNLEGQVSSMHHQKQSLEEAISVERNRSADNIQQLEKKLRDVQDMLVVKMKEITNVREANLPLKAEIEALKALLEEEEKRLRVPLGIVPASVVQTPPPQTITTKEILSSSVSNQVLKPRSPPNPIAALSAQPTSVGFVTSQVPSSSGVVVNGNFLSTTVNASSSEPQTCVTQPSIAKTVSIAPQSSTQALTAEAVMQSSSSAAATTAFACQPMTTSNHVSATYCYPPSVPIGSGLANPLYPYIPSPPLDPMYIPEALQSVDDAGTLAYDQDYGTGDGVVGYFDVNSPLYDLPMSGPRYCYEANPSVNRLHVEPSPPISPKQGTNLRAKSAPASKAMVSTSQAAQIAAARERNLNLVPSDMGNGRDYFEEMFNDLQQGTLFSAKSRPKSSPLERPVPSTYHDYTVSTSSAIGDLKILEVNQEGKYVRLVNDGPTEFEFGGYMVQQNVGGHPVAVFRFPPRTKFPPDSTITIWSAMNDPHLHNPPTDFYWKEQQKWGTGPECTTILCRANGQAVAWTTAAHRFTKDAFIENKTEEDSNKFDYDKVKDDDDDDEMLKELTLDANGPRPEPVYLRREKQQPPTLVASKHPHGASPTNMSHPQTGQPRPLRYGNDNSSVNRQSRTQSTRPDPIPGQPYAGAPAQRVGSAPLRKMGNQGTIRGNGNVMNRSNLEPGDTSESPSPFMKPHSRFETGLEQVQSQHHPNFLPPMPRPPQASC